MAAEGNASGLVSSQLVYRCTFNMSERLSKPARRVPFSEAARLSMSIHAPIRSKQNPVPI